MPLLTRSHRRIPYISPYQKATHAAMEKTKKDKLAKRPPGRQPVGAVLVDGKWQMTELAVRLAAERLMRLRENARIRDRKTREPLRLARPQLFVKGLHPSQTTLVHQTTLVRSTKENVDPLQCQKTDTTNYDAFWRSVQRDEDGAPNLSSESTSL